MSYFRENIEKTEGYTPGFQPASTDVIKLNTNENPYPPSPLAMQALAAMDAEKLRRYPDPVGNEFRKAAGQLHGLAPENIMCSNGGDELLSIVFRAFCDENRSAAYPVPTYSLYPVLAKLQDCKAIEVPFDEEFNLPAKLANTGAAVTIVCNPNAPSGSFISIEELVSLADELSGILLIDEAYVDFAEANCISLVKSFDNVILLRSLSKGYSLAGMRFGYAISNPQIIEGLMKVKDSYNADAVAITLATAAIKDQAYFKENVTKIKAERKRVTEQLRSLGFKVADSFSNFVLATCKNIEAKQVYTKLAEQNIFIRYFELPGLTDKLRITIGTKQQNDKLLLTLKKILSE
jgi:histidinol-phosphate aminotransferase